MNRSYLRWWDDGRQVVQVHAVSVPEPARASGTISVPGISYVLRDYGGGTFSLLQTLGGAAGDRCL